MMECNRCHTPLPDYAKFCLTCGLDVSGNPVGHTLAEADPALLAKLQEDLGEDFLVERELGRGGMAIVYLARDVHIGRKVAVKVLPPELTFTHGAGFVDRFKREARTAGGLEHPNIIPIHRVSTDGKMFWYIMKFVEGESLDHVLKREGQMSIRKTADILAATADALDYAHKRGVIHRDIKPGNVLLDPEGKVTITDFGIAKAFLGESLTVSGSILGTPYYMSPEQCAGKQLTGAADQYSLAIMAYQMLAGHLPFQGESAVEIIKKHTLDPPPPIQVLRPGVPLPAAAAIERALAKDPKDRFPTARDFVRAFEKPSEENTSPMSAEDTDIVKRATEKLKQLPAILMPTMATPLPMINAPVSHWALAIRDRISFITHLAGHVVASAWMRIEPVVAKLDPLWARLAPVRARVAPVLDPVLAQWRGLNPRVRMFGWAAVVMVLILAALPNRAAQQARADSIAADSAAAVASALAAARRDSAAAAARRSAELHSVLRLRVRPVGATVLVDGAPATGDTVRISAGKHLIVVSKQGFRTVTDSVTARDSQTVSKSFNLVALPGRLFVATSVKATPPDKPTVTLVVNGNRVANPVNNLEVPAGTVKVRFQVVDAKGAWAVESTFTIVGGETLRRSFALARPPAGAAVNAATGGAAAVMGKLSLSTNIPGATLTVNGAAVPNPVIDYAVPVGKVIVHIVAKTPSGATWETDSVLNVTRRTPLTKKFQLKPVDVVATASSAQSLSGPRRPRPPRVPAALPAQLLTVPGQARAATLLSGYEVTEMNVFTPSCVRFAELFWDVMGYDIDLGGLCTAASILTIRGNSPERLLNFTRFVRTKDGGIESVERPAEVGEWRNEATGKRLRFRIRGDSIAVTDETPDVALTRASTRRASRSVSTRQAPEPQGGTVGIVRTDGFGAAVKTPRDSLPVAGLTEHGHRIGSCTGLLSFDGETFRYVPAKGDHKYEFGLGDVLNGTIDKDRGTLRIRVGGGSERLTIREWQSVFEAIVVAKMD